VRGTHAVENNAVGLAVLPPYAYDDDEGDKNEFDYIAFYRELARNAYLIRIANITACAARDQAPDSKFLSFCFDELEHDLLAGCAFVLD